ncbi:hypothetical protein ADL25_33250 [Streptomyces sp. NRRL F-5122]|nr:hypothetical protein ADL25_33250 [Streptomyces sp. NRRL F-5122]
MCPSDTVRALDVQARTGAATGADVRGGGFTGAVFGLVAGVLMRVDGLGERAPRSSFGGADDGWDCRTVAVSAAGACGSTDGRSPMPPQPADCPRPSPAGTIPLPRTPLHTRATAPSRTVHAAAGWKPRC